MSTPRIDREIPLSWGKSRVKVSVYLPYRGDWNVFITILQKPVDDPIPGGSDIVCLNRADVDTLKKFVDDVVTEAKAAPLAVC